MLKPYSELVQVDVRPFCDTRKAKDDSGKQIEVPYLNWAKCKQLLHENGANEVYYIPLKDKDGSFVFSSLVVQNKDGRETGCYFVSVEIHIDDRVFTMDMPLMNGALVVYKDTLNQLRIANCHARAFVKGVAIHTGLGFSLWLGDEDTDKAPDDLSGHNALVIRQRIEQLVTAKMQKGMDFEDILSSLGIKEKQFSALMNNLTSAHNLEQLLKAL